MGELLGGLTTRGRCLLAAGLAAVLCAVALNERDLLRVAAFIVVLPLLASYLARRVRFGLRAHREPRPDRVAVGGTTTVVLTLRGEGTPPFTELVLADTVPYALGTAPRLLVERPRRGGIGTVRYELRPTARGVHRIGPLRARVGDPFGLAEFDRALIDTNQVTVVPRHVALTGLPGGPGTTGVTDGASDTRSGHGEHDVMIRPYRNGDDMRRVHWRSSARRDELMVRLEEQPWRAGATVLLDTRTDAHRGTGATSSFEWAVSMTASIATHLVRNGFSVRVITESGRPLVDTGTVDDHGPSAGVALVLDALASVTTSHRREITVGAESSAGRYVLAVLGDAGIGDLAAHGHLRGAGSAVLLDIRAWGGSPTGPDPTASTLRGAGWRVAVAGPDDTMRATWDEMCGRHTPAVAETTT